MSLPFSSQKPLADAIGGDAAQMAAHMRQCEAACGGWSGLQSGLQRVSVATAGRLVTVACLGATLIGVLAAFS